LRSGIGRPEKNVQRPAYLRGKADRTTVRLPSLFQEIAVEARKPEAAKLADLPSAGKTVDPKRAQEVKGGVKYTMFLADGTPCR
jgi:hypothetical protein